MVVYMITSILQPMVKPIMGSVFGGGTPWTFADTTAFAFYDMNTGITDAGSGKVSAWNDSLGTTARNLAQGTGANRPTLTSDGGEFNGSTDFLFNSNPFMMNSTNGVIVMAVMSAPSAILATSEWILCEASSVSNNQHLVILGKDTASLDLGKDTQQIRNDANTVITGYGLNPNTNNAYDNTFKILVKKFDKVNNEISLRINGVNGDNTLSVAPTGTFTLNRFSLGALVRGVNLNYSELTLKGLVILDASISDVDSLRAEGYLAHLYEQTSLLPSDHPYRHAPPTL